MVAPTLTSLVANTWDNNASIYTWIGLTNNSFGTAISGPGWTDRSFQVTGTFGGSTVTCQGSNDGINWFTLHDPFSNPISFGVAGLAEVTEITLYMRPNVANGDGTTNLTVVMVCCNHSRN